MGDAWAPAGDPVRFIAVMALARSIGVFSGAILYVCLRPKWNFMAGILGIIGVAVLVPLFGTRGIVPVSAALAGLAIAIVFFQVSGFDRRLIGPGDILGAVRVPAACAAVMALTVTLGRLLVEALTPSHPILLSFMIVVGALTYVGMLVVMDKEELKAGIAMLRGRLASRHPV